MNVQTLIACAVIVCAFLIYRYMQRKREEPAYFDALELSDAVQELARIMEQPDNIHIIAIYSEYHLIIHVRNICFLISAS